MFVFLGLNTVVSLEQAEDLLPEKESPVIATAEGRAYLLVPQERGGTEEGVTMDSPNFLSFYPAIS